MNRLSAVVAASLLVSLLASCSREKRESQQVTPASSAEAVNQENPPQDFVEVDQEPVVIKKAEPLYPELARKAGLEGTVWVKIWVDTAGKPKQVTILKSDADVFNQVAVDAAKQFEFKPARIKDRPVSVWVSVPFKYKLADKPGSQDAKAGMKSASPEEKSFMKGYISAKEDALSAMQKEADDAKKNGMANPALEKKIQAAKGELQALKDALRAMQAAK